MPNFILPLLLLLLSILCNSGAGDLLRYRNSNSGVYKVCKKTSYPELCIQYLSIFPKSVTQSPKKTANAGLLVSLYRVQKTRSFIKKAAVKIKAMKRRDYGVMQDCLEVFSDEVSLLSESIIELRHMGLGRQMEGDVECDIACHVFNIQSSLSAALSDASTCAEEFDEFLKKKSMGKLMATIKAKALNAEQATAVGLDLFCQFAKCST
ncbi:pectinesterase inhibitor 9-like [Mercurialis annua]|uniref:pectinesterase inhibitor 9-like n=1 Tax=Mercurialis annua TaxID=3986 RepID=UPI00215F4D5B|nr:pectinesterase inhibitor 9-like [Mercurialis annua]